MIPESFGYSAPTTLQEAFSLLAEHGEDAKILAGGHSLIPMMKLRFASPTHLVDINRIPGLSYVKEENGFLKIGAMTKESAMEESSIIREKYPIFTDAAKLIADPQVRNFGTIGGNIAHGDAANDHPAVMMALDAEVEIASPSGSRTVSINDFFYGFYTTAIQHGEILTEIRIPTPANQFGCAYHKAERKVGDYATAGVAVAIHMDRGGVCRKARIGLTNVNSTPMRATQAEAALEGTTLTADDIKKAGQLASTECNPSSDLRGDEEYKRHLVGIITQRMIKKSLERIK
ncbi:MAG: xanthine dehydrogenase family protein subunit M [Bacteroidota bacterium]